MSISVVINPVRNFTATDVYHYTTLSRPIAALKDNDDLLAAALVKCVDKTGDIITGIVDAPTALPACNTDQIANVAFIYNELRRGAEDFTVATQAHGNSSASVASTAFVQNAMSGTTGSGNWVNKTGDIITGIVDAPTALPACNTDQIANVAFIYNELRRGAEDFTVATQAHGNSSASVASTAFVQNAIGTGTTGTGTTGDLFPAGTRMPFAQASAPTGWTQDTTDAASNRMLRVVVGAGAGTGGTHSPIYNDVVPAHTHGFTTGIESTSHSHNIGDPSHSHIYGPNEYIQTAITAGAYTSSDGQNSVGHLANTAVASTGIWNGGVTVNHTHSGGTDNGSSNTNWAPRYIDMIICTKN